MIKKSKPKYLKLYYCENEIDYISSTIKLSDNLILQNILILCCKQPLSVEQLSLKMNVPIIYLEKYIFDLCEHSLLINVNSLYITNFDIYNYSLNIKYERFDKLLIKKVIKQCLLKVRNMEFYKNLNDSNKKNIAKYVINKCVYMLLNKTFMSFSEDNSNIYGISYEKKYGKILDNRILKFTEYIYIIEKNNNVRFHDYFTYNRLLLTNLDATSILNTLYKIYIKEDVSKYTNDILIAKKNKLIKEVENKDYVLNIPIINSVDYKKIIIIISDTVKHLVKTKLLNNQNVFLGTRKYIIFNNYMFHICKKMYHIFKLGNVYNSPSFIEVNND